MTKSTMIIDEEGTKRWRNKSGQLHRDDGPAVEWADGSKSWYQNGKLHRLDGPAVGYVNGDKHWCQNGKLHREDGPAVEHSDGTVVWYFKDKRLERGLKGFWKLWAHLDEVQRQNVNLHMWLAKLTD